MSMMINHNFSAQLALGELNKNVSQVGSMLAKVSSGQKVTGAKDDASAYSISEKMREKIRSLMQDSQNVQNGASLIKVASGGVERIIDELRSLKELAINAANDTNTDEDRAIIQKEINQRLDDINDIATTTNFNGKYLLDGTYGYKDLVAQIGTSTEFRIERQIVDYDIKSVTVGPPSYTVIYNDNGTAYYIQDNDFDIAKAFLGLTTDTYKTRSYFPGQIKAYNGMSCDFKFETYSKWNWQREMNKTYSGATFSGKTFAAPTSTSVTSYNNMAVSMNFNLAGISTVDDLNGEGFSILCGGCDQYINFKLDSSIDSSDSDYSATMVKGRANADYVIGIKDLTTISNDALSEAIFNGLQAAHTNANVYTSSDTVMTTSDGTSQVVSTYIDSAHDLRVGLNPQYDSSDSTKGSKYIILKQPSPSMNFISGGTLMDQMPNPENLTGTVTTLIESPTTITVSTPIYGDVAVNVQVPVYGRLARLGDPLHIHHGTQANQAIAVLLKDMHTKSMKSPIPSASDKERLASMDSTSSEYAAFKNTLEKAADLSLEDISVQTREDANVAIKVIESSLEYALDLATTLGAYERRMAVSYDNVTTMSENVQAAESTIRDADMAHEMTNYVKSNVLRQSAQSMLAQANQEGSNILSLLS